MPRRCLIKNTAPRGSEPVDSESGSNRAKTKLTATIITRLSVPGVSKCSVTEVTQIHLADQTGRTVPLKELYNTIKYGTAMRAELLLHDGASFPDGAKCGKVYCDTDGRLVFCEYGKNALDMKACKCYLLYEGPCKQGPHCTAVPLEGGNDPSTAVWRDSRPALILLPKPRETYHFGHVLRLQEKIIPYRCRSTKGEKCFTLVPAELERCADVESSLRLLRGLMRTTYAPPEKMPENWERHAKHFVLHVLRKLTAGARLGGNQSLEQMEGQLTATEQALVSFCVAEWDPAHQQTTTQPQLEQPDYSDPAGDAEDEAGERVKKDVDVTARGLSSAFECCPTAAERKVRGDQGDAPYNPPSGTGGVEMVVDEEAEEGDPASPAAPRQLWGRLIADAEQQRWHNLRYHNGEQTECYLYIGVGMEGGPELRASQWSCGMNQ